MSEQNKAIAKRIFEAVSRGNLEAFDELVAGSHVYHSDPHLNGPEGQKQMVTMFRTAFPDLQLTVDAQVAEGDMVVSRVTARGTHNGDLMGVAPTGKRVTVSSISMMRMAGGKVAEEWELIDEAGMMRQLGVIPSE